MTNKNALDEQRRTKAAQRNGNETNSSRSIVVRPVRFCSPSICWCIPISNLSEPKSALLDDYGNSGGAARFFVACSNAYASAINLGSLQAVPVKLTLNGAGLGSKPAGKQEEADSVDAG